MSHTSSWSCTKQTSRQELFFPRQLCSNQGLLQNQYVAVPNSVWMIPISNFFEVFFFFLKKVFVIVLFLIDSLTNAGGLRDEGQIELNVINRARNKIQQKVTHTKRCSLVIGFFPYCHLLFKGLCALLGVPSKLKESNCLEIKLLY